MKIVKLEIEDELFDDLGTFQIGLVEHPAHQVDFMYFRKEQEHKFVEVPEYVREAAQRVVDYTQENGWGSCGTPVGKKRANDLATAGYNASLETLKRMYSYGSRHKQDWDTSPDFETGCGFTSLAAWGFLPSNYDRVMAWLERTIQAEEEMAKHSKKKKKKGYMVDSAKGFSVGDYVSWTYAGRSGDDDRGRGQIINIRVEGEVNIPDSDFTLTATEERPVALIETSSGRVVGQYIDGDMRQIQKPDNFDYEDDDREMVEGIIELLNKVNDIENRKLMAKDVIKDFARDGIVYNYDEFLMRIGLLGQMEFQQYPDIADALEEAYILGCKGTHRMELGWAPCETHEEYERLLKEQEMVCDTEECRITGIIDEVSVSIEDILDDGWIIGENIDITDEMALEIMEKLKELAKKEGNDFYDKFYTIQSNPNAPSLLDTPGRRVRFIFKPGPGRPATMSTSRTLCKQMIRQFQLVYRIEDIFNLSQQLNVDANSFKLVPRPAGTTVNQFVWKNGANCNHIWSQLLFLDDETRIPNSARRAGDVADVNQPAAGQSGQLNPPAVQTRLGYELEIPISYTYGLPIFRDLGTAEITSQRLGCNGKLKQIEYRGGMAYVPCMENEEFRAVKQNSFSIDDEKRIITGPAVIPDKLIVRVADEYTEGLLPGEKYYVYFDKDTVRRMSQKFLMEGRTKSANLDHSGIPLDDCYLVESWIIESENDKAYSIGFAEEQVPVGTWMVSYRIDNKDIWDNYVKKQKVLGWSVEGNYLMSDPKEVGNESEFSIQPKSDERLMNDIINILKQVKKL